MHRHYYPEECELDGGPTPPGVLVDEPLSPLAGEAARQMRLSLIEPVGRRAVAVFLGRDDYQKVGGNYGLLMAGLLMECLPRFVHDRGGQSVASLILGERGEVLNPDLDILEVDGGPRLILRNGYLFIRLPDARVVVSSDSRYSGDRSRFDMLVRSSGDPAAFWRDWQAYAREHNYLRGRSFFADGALIERERKYSWEDILLPEPTRQTIRIHVEGFLRNRDRLKKLGVKPRRGLILAGPPGTGKTLLGKVLADTLGVSFMWVSPRHVREADSFADIMATARFLAPAVVFLEDLDLFAEQRDHKGWTGLGELMNQLDGAADNQGIVTIATTNRLEVIEKALRNRPGRFDRVIEFGPLDEACRREMLSRLLAGAIVVEADMDYLVLATDEYTGAQVEELCATLAMKALEGDTARDDTSGSPTEPGPDGPGGLGVRLDRSLMDAGLGEMQIERKARLGFHAS